jgi:hypothetical protein
MLAMTLLSPAGDEATEVICPLCDVDDKLQRLLGRGVMYTPSHAGDRAAESCWQQRC